MNRKERTKEIKGKSQSNRDYLNKLKQNDPQAYDQLQEMKRMYQKGYRAGLARMKNEVIEASKKDAKKQYNRAYYLRNRNNNTTK